MKQVGINITQQVVKVDISVASAASGIITEQAIVDALGYTPENVANKAKEWSEVASEVKYPSEKMVADRFNSLREIKGIKTINSNYTLTADDSEVWINVLGQTHVVDISIPFDLFSDFTRIYIEKAGTSYVRLIELGSSIISGTKNLIESNGVITLQNKGGNVWTAYGGTNEPIPDEDSIFDFLWTGEFEGDNLKNDVGSTNIIVTGKDFTTEIPESSAASLTIAAAFVAADNEDRLWFNSVEVQQNVSPADLIGYDFYRTIIKYSNTSPFSISKIAILKPNITLTQQQINQLHIDFDLPVFWSDLFNENGIVKSNRGLFKQIKGSISPEAIAMADDYQAMVLADGGEIISRSVVEQEYQRILNTGDADKLWYAYHFEAGVKRVTVNYGGTDYTMVSKWYNMSRVTGRIGIDVMPYNIVAPNDARPEYTSLGIRFRPTNLDGGTRCGLESAAASVLTNNNGILRQRGIVTSLGASSITTKGYQSADGIFKIDDAATTRKFALIYYNNSGASVEVRSNNDNIFVNGEEVEFDFTANFVNQETTLLINGADAAINDMANSKYPAHNYKECIGHGRDLGRTPFNGYIKQIELYTL